MARRLWRAFCTGRVLSALVLLMLLLPQSSQLHSAFAVFSWVLGGVYLVIASLGWVLLRKFPPNQHWGLPWLIPLALEVAIISLVQLLQLWQPGSTVHFSPLLALPILVAASLGTLRLALAVTASITLLLLGGYAMAAMEGLPNGWELTMQAALVCAGYFVVAYLTHHLAQRLAWQERLARKNHRIARTQGELNSLIIDKLAEGVLVVDQHLRVQQANPAALQLLGRTHAPPASLHEHPSWQPLVDLVTQCLLDGRSQDARMYLLEMEQAPIGLYVRVWPSQYSVDDGLPGSEHAYSAEDSQYSPISSQCLVFLEDLRELEAQLRTEKMAAMGRMSAAVAHEIRNPLAAIMQANALLSEDLTQPAQQRLAQMITDNAQRLANTVEDVLDIARVQQQIQHSLSCSLELDAELARIWQEWQAQDPSQRLGSFHPHCTGMVAFDAEHLRRIIVNLLDNAQRHVQGTTAARIWLSSGRSRDGQAWAQVWSDGTEIEASVQKHLFEPFFSSQSRSSGLGLFICRELCQRHGASISYRRQPRSHHPDPSPGNAFTLRFARTRQDAPLGGTSSLFDFQTD